MATGEEDSCLARNVVLATGGVPCPPDGITLQKDGRAFHWNNSMIRLKRDSPDKNAPYRFVVVGSGQSGAELFDYLMTHYPTRTSPRPSATSTSRWTTATSPTRSSSEHGGYLFELPDEKRKMILDHAGT